MNVKQEELLNEARRTMRVLLQAGYEAYMVGGFVRDYVLGIPVHDIDIATSAAPADVVRLFDRAVPTGIQHGTVTVISGHYRFEVTTFRKEGKYADHRRPEHVTFVSSLEEDLSRRDFTMNAMAMNIDGEIIDPYGGKSDLQAGLLRCVGVAEKRFEEDALRMLRCIRFAANYRLQIHEEAWQAIINCRKLLRYIAMERVRIELDKTIGGADPLRGVELLIRSQLLAYTKEVLDWLPFTAPSTGHAERLLSRLSGSFTKVTPPVRMACLMLASERSSTQADALLRQLTYSNEARSRVVKLLLLHEFISEQMKLRTEASAHADLSATLRSVWVEGVIQYGAQAAEDLLQCLFLYPAFGWFEPFANHAAEWFRLMTVRSPGELAVNGHEIASLGIRGKLIGKLLQQLTIDTALGELPNKQEELLGRAKEYVKKWGLG